MDAKTRPLLIIALLGLTLVPYLLGSRDQNAQKPAPGKSAPAAQQPQPVAPAASPAASKLDVRAAEQQSARIETEAFSAKVTNLNGGLTSFVLKGDRYHTRGKPVDIVTTDRPQYLPLAVEITGWNSDAAPKNWELQQLSPNAVSLTLETDGLRVSRKIEAGQGPYQLWLTTHVVNRGQSARKVQLQVATHHYVTREAEGSKVPLLPVRSSATSHGVCRHGGDLERKDHKSLATPIEKPGPIEFAGVENVYFLSAIAPDDNSVERCRIEASDRPNTEHALGSLFGARLLHKPVSLEPGGQKTWRTLAYLGPKSPTELGAAGHSLKTTIESGWFSSLAEGLTWLLRKIHDGVGNWGIAIILLTLLVKAVLFPLTARQMQSMARMKELKPELDRINEMYKDDREKKGAAIMELYRKRGVNPMAGCFPVLLQMPIWFSLYASLSSNVELFRAPFALWWTDLSSPDAFFILPLALGVLMFVQQKISPATGVDPVQQKMMLYMMPAMITSFMLFLPSGLCLYMLTNSALSIGQQRLIEARLRAGSAPAQ
jgi:YidC/Oxa1 family membrane protein insertase